MQLVIFYKTKLKIRTEIKRKSLMITKLYKSECFKNGYYFVNKVPKKHYYYYYCYYYY